MSRVEKILKDVLSGTSDANIAFMALCQLLKRLGFQERTKGSKAKPYQVKQVRGIILKYKMEV